MRDRVFTIAKIAITFGLIAYVFSKVDLQAVATSLLHANPWLVLLALLFYLIAIAINGVKWYVLLRAQEVMVPFRAVLQYMWVGVFFNNVFPANIGGDVMRGYGMARYTDRTAEAAVSVVVDRIIGLIAYMSTAAVMAVIIVTVMGYSNLRWLFYLAIVALIAIAAALAVLLSRRLRTQVGRLFQFPLLAPFAPLYQGVSDAFDAYRTHSGSLVLAFGIALTGLMSANIVNWLLFQATGGGVPFLYVLLFNPLIALVLLVPISVGGHGVIQGAYPFFYGLVGVPEIQAVAVSVLMSFIIIMGSLPGGVLWWRNRGASSDSSDSPTVTASQPSG
ncbi:MAG: lysylphosphatidylglycerol synthase transmembrane domain-containing protein [Chloroflexota bacterium]|nr:lysylphosphatidylglycerol synthase transmembrane domain-containing protein [Chloroflexota bacterium]